MTGSQRKGELACPLAYQVSSNSLQVLRNYPSEHLVLRDICLSSDSKWMVCVGPYIREDTRLPQKYGIIGAFLVLTFVPF